MKKVLLALFLSVLLPVVVDAQENQEARESIKVYFRQGESAIDGQYMNNDAAMQEFVERIKSHLQNDKTELRKVRVLASTSPEGALLVNSRIADMRALSIIKWIRKTISPDIYCSIVSAEIEWEPLIQFIEADSQVPYRDEVLDLLRSVPAQVKRNGVMIPERQNKLMALRGGVPYQWIFENIYPKLRYTTAEVTIWWEVEPKINISSGTQIRIPYEGSEAVIAYTKSDNSILRPSIEYDAEWIDAITFQPDGLHFMVASNPSNKPRVAHITLKYFGKEYKVEVIQEGSSVQPKPQPKPQPQPQSEVKSLEPFYMSLKTNMLYDVAAIPNIGIEFYLGKNWSLAANAQLAWWANDDMDFIWRVNGADLALRKWFGKRANAKPLTGHHVGIYGQALTYDFCVDRKQGVLAEKLNTSVGLEYGYSLPIARRLNLDFTLGVGYHWGEYKEYDHIDTHNVWQATKQRQFFGPTKAEVSLVWLLGRGNYNKEKGGKR